MGALDIFTYDYDDPDDYEVPIDEDEWFEPSSYEEDRRLWFGDGESQWKPEKKQKRKSPPVTISSVTPFQQWKTTKFEGQVLDSFGKLDIYVAYDYKLEKFVFDCYGVKRIYSSKSTIEFFGKMSTYSKKFKSLIIDEIGHGIMLAHIEHFDVPVEIRIHPKQPIHLFNFEKDVVLDRLGEKNGVQYFHNVGTVRFMEDWVVVKSKLGGQPYTFQCDKVSINDKSQLIVEADGLEYTFDLFSKNSQHPKMDFEK